MPIPATHFRWIRWWCFLCSAFEYSATNLIGFWKFELAILTFYAQQLDIGTFVPRSKLIDFSLICCYQEQAKSDSGLKMLIDLWIFWYSISKIFKWGISKFSISNQHSSGSRILRGFFQAIIEAKQNYLRGKDWTIFDAQSKTPN